MLPPAPGLFSTMNGCPKVGCMYWPRRRPNWSVVPPALKGTMMVTGFAGQAACCATDAAAVARTAKAASASVFMGFLRIGSGVIYLRRDDGKARGERAWV